MAGAAQTSHANSTESSETEIAGLASGPASHLGALHTAFRSQPAAATVPFPDLSSRSSSSLLSPSLFFPSLSSSSLWPRAGEKEKAAAWSERLEDVTQSSGTRQAEDRVVSTNYARRSANVMRPAELLQLETATVANHALAALTVILFVAVMVFRCRHRQAGHTRDVGLVMSSSRSKKPAARRGCWLSRLWVRPFRYLVCQWGRLRLKLSSCAAGEAYKGPVLGAAAGRTEICAEAQMERAAVDGGHILFCDQTMGSAIRSLTRRSSPTATRLAETAVAFSENFKPGSASLRPNGHPLLTTSRRVEERRHNVGTSTRVAAGILGAATFYRKIQGWGACIIAVMDEQGHIFGGFVNDSWKVDFCHYFGSGECFLFKVHPYVRIYPWARTNSHFVYGSSSGIAFGSRPVGATDAAHPGLFLDASLEWGSSAAAPGSTFGNEPLASALEFRAVKVEAWLFDSSKHL